MPRSCLRLVPVGLLTVGLVGCVPATDPGPVTVRLVNASDFTLDPNLYAASGTLSSSALFVPANLVTSFADGGLATIEPRASRTATIGCDAAGTLGQWVEGRGGERGWVGADDPLSPMEKPGPESALDYRP